MANTTTTQTTETDDSGIHYYNREKIKRKQRDNKDTTCGSSSSGLVADAPQVNPEGALAEALSLERCQEEGAELLDSSPLDQAPMPQVEEITPQDLIKEDDVKRCYLQLFHNKNSKQEWKLKCNLNFCIDGGKEETAEFIATLTTNRENFKKYHPPGTSQWVMGWSDTQSDVIKQRFKVKAKRGKFHLNNGWNKNSQQVNQIEPWCQAVVWFDPEGKKWYAAVVLYGFEICVELIEDYITDAQKKVGVHRQKLWYNPTHYTPQRPQTFAKRRFGK